MTASTALVPQPTASLPTYQTVAAVLEGKNGSGIRLAAWTVARTMLIAPPFLALGVKPKLALTGAALSSGLISLLTLLRIYNAAFVQRQQQPPRRDG